MKQVLILIFIVLNTFSTEAQNVTARIIDAATKKPVPYATIKTGKYSGVISNDEGYFTISTEDENKIITISCMGYENKELSIKAIKSQSLVITLNEAINKLDEVYISNKKPNVDYIIARVKARLTENYSTALHKYEIFKRSTDYVDFKSLDFEIEKAKHVKKENLEKANKSLAAMGKQIRESNIVSFEDFKGTLYTFNKDSSKIVVDKATKLLDHKNDFSIDNVQEKSQEIVLTYLDTTKTYKLKTGIFKIEDSLSLKSEDFKDEEKNEYNLANLNDNTRYLLRRAQFYKNSFLNRLLNTNYYEYELMDIGFNNGELTYIINFEPRKGKAKYGGTLYVADETYAITRANYKYYKKRRGKSMNLKLLLGVKYSENVSEGTVIFEKDSSNAYHPKYINRTTGSYFYVSRGLKFIENSLNRYKIGFDFKLEGDYRDKEELLITAHKPLTQGEFTSITQDKKVSITTLNRYEKTLWENEAIIEPSLEMKRFEGGE